MAVDENIVKSVEKIGHQVRLELFKKFTQIREGHPGSILSIFDIVNAIYTGGYIRLDNESGNNDCFIMSKGHAAAVQYPFLVRKGIISELDWQNWGIGDSTLRIFGNNNIPGIDVTSGSLGHGAGIGAGLALANRLNNLEARIWVIISEGELYEGSTWEALLFIAHHNLSDVKLILDVNNNMILGRPEECISLKSIEAKMQAFNFETFQIDGHSYTEIFDGLEYLIEPSKSPKVLIADTIKGKGVSFMEDKAESHYWGDLDEEKMSQMIKDLS